MNLQRNRSEADNNWFEFNTGLYTPTSLLFIYLSNNNQDQRIKNILDASSHPLGELNYIWIILALLQSFTSIIMRSKLTEKPEIISSNCTKFSAPGPIISYKLLLDSSESGDGL